MTDRLTEIQSCETVEALDEMKAGLLAEDTRGFSVERLTRRSDELRALAERRADLQSAKDHHDRWMEWAEKASPTNEVSASAMEDHR